MSLRDPDFSSSGCRPSGVTWHTVGPCLTSWRPSALFQSGGTISHPTDSAQALTSARPLRCSRACRVLGHSHAKRCEVETHCGFDLHSPDDERCRSSFHEPAEGIRPFTGVHQRQHQTFRPMEETRAPRNKRPHIRPVTSGKRAQTTPQGKTVSSTNGAGETGRMCEMRTLNP